MTSLNEQLLALCAIDGVNWHVLAREAQKPGGLSSLLAGDVHERSNQGRETQRLVRGALVAGLNAQLNRTGEEIHRANDAGAKLITVLDDEYPANLRVIFNLPPFLFVRGELTREDARAVAVVGTRTASAQGLAAAHKMAGLLADGGVTVVSGLALGIDAAAHEATLDHGGRTIAVIGTGILRTYPKKHVELAERIVATGALVSQFWPSQSPARYTFPRRNVVTSGIGQGTVVIEATSTSGAKMQARLALEHGKQVFLVRRLVTTQPWAQRYLDRGAVEVASVEDVLTRLRTPEQVEELTAGRRQLTLELA